MGLWFIRIRVPTAEIQVQADRRLAFQVLTAWGAAGPDGAPTAKVLETNADRVLCEFYTPVNAIFGLKWVQRTVEWVTLSEPERIEFEAIKVPLPLLLCVWTLDELGACCLFKYDSIIALHGSVIGWIFGILFIRPMFKRLMQEHLVELKQTIESRAARSRVFPQRPCPPDEITADMAQRD